MTFEAAIKRREAEQTGNTILAWQTAALSRTERMPSLERLLEGPPKPLTADELAEKRRHAAEVKARLGGNRGRSGEQNTRDG